jgi:hypothetical protein
MHMQRTARLPYRATRGNNKSLHLLYSISTLREKQAVLQEEVLQLQTAVNVYRKIVEELAARTRATPERVVISPPVEVRFRGRAAAGVQFS